MAQQEKKTAGIFDIRNIIGALLTIYGVILTLMGLFADPETEKTGGSNANLVAGILLLIIGIGFMVWAQLGRSRCPSTSSRCSTTRPDRRRRSRSGLRTDLRVGAAVVRRRRRGGPAGGRRVRPWVR